MSRKKGNFILISDDEDKPPLYTVNESNVIVINDSAIDLICIESSELESDAEDTARFLVRSESNTSASLNNAQSSSPNKRKRESSGTDRPTKRVKYADQSCSENAESSSRSETNQLAALQDSTTTRVVTFNMHSSGATSTTSSTAQQRSPACSSNNMNLRLASVQQKLPILTTTQSEVHAFGAQRQHSGPRPPLPATAPATPDWHSPSSFQNAAHLSHNFQAPSSHPNCSPARWSYPPERQNCPPARQNCPPARQNCPPERWNSPSFSQGSGKCDRGLAPPNDIGCSRMVYFKEAPSGPTVNSIQSQLSQPLPNNFFFCQICNEKIQMGKSKYQAFKQHFKELHLSPSTYCKNCKVDVAFRPCGSSAATNHVNSAIMRHFSHRLSNHRIKCPICPNSTQLLLFPEFAKHVQKTHMENDYVTCPDIYCRKKTISHEGFCHHYLSKHVQHVAFSTHYTCKLCGHRLDHEDYLLAHFVQEHGTLIPEEAQAWFKNSETRRVIWSNHDDPPQTVQTSMVRDNKNPLQNASCPSTTHEKQTANCKVGQQVEGNEAAPVQSTGCSSKARSSNIQGNKNSNRSESLMKEISKPSSSCHDKCSSSSLVERGSSSHGNRTSSSECRPLKRKASNDEDTSKLQGKGGRSNSSESKKRKICSENLSSEDCSSSKPSRRNKSGQSKSKSSKISDRGKCSRGSVTNSLADLSNKQVSSAPEEPSQDLSQYSHILFIDLDNWGRFFNLPYPLSGDVFVWGFCGGKYTKSRQTSTHFRSIVRENRFFQHPKCGRSKNAADFALCVKAARLDLLLPFHIPFTVLSGDKGFDELQNQLKSSKRQINLVNPHEQDQEMLYTILRSIGET